MNSETIRQTAALSLAPMVGVTDAPFRLLCRRFGAQFTTSEMVSANPELRHSRRSTTRRSSLLSPALKETSPAIQIVGFCPEALADMARFCESQGAGSVDINMGCPAKKVCKKLAGSSLLKDEKLVDRILKKVVNSVKIPVTLKYRLGWDRASINATAIARIAENAGITRLALHGRTRACRFDGQVDYSAIAEVVQSVSIPVFANGDITSPIKAKEVLKQTGAFGLMVGRGALGRPWIFQEIQHYLSTGKELSSMPLEDIKLLMLEHLQLLYDFYGEDLGVKIARKHVKWTMGRLIDDERFFTKFNQLKYPLAQLASAQEQFERSINGEVMAA